MTAKNHQISNIVNQIYKFRDVILSHAKHDKNLNNDIFYEKLNEFCFSSSSQDGIFYNLINLLNSGIVNKKPNSHVTYWLNYNPKYSFSKERLGRIVNQDECAYYYNNITRHRSILKSDTHIDYNVYYFYRIVGNDMGVKKNLVISIQQVLINLNNEIEQMALRWDYDQNDLEYTFTDFNGKEWSEYDSSLKTELFKGENSKQKQENYKIFLQKTFGIKADLPPYVMEDNFQFNKAEYIPRYFYVCNLSSPYSLEYNGTIMLASDCQIESELLRTEINKIKSILDILRNIEIEYEDFKNIQIIRSESIKSAMAAIMSRNMSHNLGSHYLYYTKAHLEQLAAKGGNFGPDIRGAAKVLGYMQARMDYLATVISNDRYPYGGVNFKSQIFDELTIDDFSKRHNDTNSKVSLNDTALILKCSQELETLYSKANNIFTPLREKERAVDRIKNVLTEIQYLTNQSISSNLTTNFLLTNLILSENFSRPCILNIPQQDLEQPNPPMNLSLQIRLNNNDVLFTGTKEQFEIEKPLKYSLSNVNIAMPGGAMSCHAFFNVIENFIRNSAKYEQEVFENKQDLTITIAIDEEENYYTFTIFDNKGNANTTGLKDRIKSKLRKLVILDDKNAIDKENKGFKEMLFSTLWMRSYQFFNDNDDNLYSYADVLSAIQTATGNNKLHLIEKYGFAIISVNKLGIDSESDNANLGIRFTLPKYQRSVPLKLNDEDFSSIQNKCLNTFGDIAIIQNCNLKYKVKIEKWFPRMVMVENQETTPTEQITSLQEEKHTSKSDVALLKKVFYQRFKEDESTYTLLLNDGGKLDESIGDKYTIFMDRHLATQANVNMATMCDKYAYVDSISGGDFTITLLEWYNAWIKAGKDTNSEDYYNILKIKEAALTRITIIDERLSNKLTPQKQIELKCRNIKVLNAVEITTDDSNNIGTTQVEKFRSLFTIKDNYFRGETSSNLQPSHFISIHLGLIEKIVKSDSFIDLCETPEQATADRFMELLRQAWGDEQTFISIHSGRGNFSVELETSLANYPFIGMATLENAYNNSKFLLCQLLYNTVYIGKGLINQH